MVFSDGSREDVGSSDYQENELRAHHFVASLGHSEQDISGFPVVNTDAGSVICTHQGDEGRSCGENDYSSAERNYPGGPRCNRYKVSELEGNINHENALCYASTLHTNVATSITAPVIKAASSTLSSSSVSNSVKFPSRLNGEQASTWSGRLHSDNPIRNNAETCQSSALGRAGNTGSIDVVTRSGLACQIRSNNVENSTLLGRLSVERRPTMEQLDSGLTPSQELVRNSDEGSPRDSSENLSRECGALRWVQALEFQGTGACRVDERLRPLLRWNVSCVGADGRLLVQLGQHFKAKELNLLARCLCAPLVHIRVGKVLRQGRLLRPITSRGFLSLTMAPGSVIRLSFIPDSGFMDLLATISVGSEAPSVSLEEIRADVSGRTFLLKLADGKVLYFWQSEKSKSTGDELVLKMKDFLNRRPTLSQLTGIDESRLDSFADYICSALNGSSPTEASQPPASAVSSENLHSCTGSSSTPCTNQTTSDASASFNGETQPVSVPTGISISSAGFGGDSSISPGRLSHGFSQRGVSSGTMPAFSIPHRGSSASLPDSSQRRHVFLRSRGVSSFGPSACFSGASEGSLSNTHDHPVLQASSWSTRTSLSDSSPEKQETSSRSVGLYTSLNTDVRGHRQDVFQKEFRTSSLAPQNIPDFLLGSSLHSLLGQSSFPSYTCSPPVPSHLPVSTASLLAPYYCPCPLGTFPHPYVPSTSVGGLISPSAPFFSVRPPSSLFPPGSLSFHEFSLSPVQLPVSTLVTAGIPIHSSGISPLQPVGSVPILRKPTPYVVRTSSALSGYSSTSSEGLGKSLYSCLRARQAMHDESCSVNLSTSACPGVSAWHSPNNLEAFVPVFDPSLSLNATAPCIKSSTEFAAQTPRLGLYRNLAETPGLYGSFESGLDPQTHIMCKSRVMGQVAPFELGLRYTSRFVEENRQAPTPAIAQVSSASSDLNFKERSFFADMVAKTRSVAGQIFPSPESCSSNGGCRTRESPPSFHSESAEDLTHTHVKDMAANISHHTDDTPKMEEERNH